MNLSNEAKCLLEDLMLKSLEHGLHFSLNPDVFGVDVCDFNRSPVIITFGYYDNSVDTPKNVFLRMHNELDDYVKERKEKISGGVINGIK